MSSASATLGGVPYDPQQITINFRSYNDGTHLLYRRGLLTKVGNIITLVIEPLGDVDNSRVTPLPSPDKLTTYYDGTAPDNFPIPAGFRPAAATSIQWIVDEAGVAVSGFLRVNQDGSIDLAKDFDFNNFNTSMGGYYAGTLSWVAGSFP